MQDPIELFPNSAVFVAEPAEPQGAYQADPTSGARWLQPTAHLLLRSSDAPQGRTSWIRLTMSGPSWIGGAWATVRIDGNFSKALFVHEYADHYFEMPRDSAHAGREWIPLDIEVQNDCRGGPDERNIAICLHDAEVIGNPESSRDPELFVLRDQLAVIQGNPPFRELLDSLSSRATPALALEVGGGLGILSALVAAVTSGNVWCIDTLDYSSTEKMPVRTRLHSILQRNEHLIANALEILPNAISSVESRITYHMCGAENLPLRDDLFDFTFSLNAFEHIRDPKQALAEIRRTLKPGGSAYLQFSPIYFSDVGSHLYDQGLLDTPWAHLTHSREEIHAMVAAQGHPTHRVDEILDSLNGHTTNYYRELFATCGLQIMYFEEIRGHVIPNATAHKQFEVVSKQFQESDLLVLGFKALLSKP
jgi:ubiquinone/menaquinone biosynthesis C-methylase UbiE